MSDNQARLYKSHFRIFITMYDELKRFVFVFVRRHEKL